MCGFLLKQEFESINKVKRTIAEIANALITHGKILSNVDAFDQKQRDIVYDHLNKLSAQLQSDYHLVAKCLKSGWLSNLHNFFGLPSQTNILEASHDIEVVATCAISNHGDGQRRNMQIRSKIKRISSNLDIFLFEEIIPK